MDSIGRTAALLAFGLVLAVAAFAIFASPAMALDPWDVPESSIQKDYAANGKRELFRLLNRQTGEHLYTPDWNEARSLALAPWTVWELEGMAWVAPQGGTPVYRLYNPYGKDHLYTSDTNEMRVLTTREGWQADNGGRPLFHSGGGEPVYRLYNERSGAHLLTIDGNEYRTLSGDPSSGWTGEGARLQCEPEARPVYPGPGEGSTPQERTVYNRIMAFKELYRQRTPWSNANTYRSPYFRMTGGGCYAFALMCSDVAFGGAPVRYIYDNPNQNIRVGDLLVVNGGSHVVVVLRIVGDQLVIAEGNIRFNDDPSIIYWGMLRDRSEPIDYVITRW